MDEASGKDSSLLGHILLEQQAVGAYAGLLGRPEHGMRWAVDCGPTPAGQKRCLPGWAPWGPWLIPATSAGERGGYVERRYPALTDPRCRDLHRKFARLATVHRSRQDEEIRRFASRFGFLSSPRDLISLKQKDADDLDFAAHPVGEHRRLWRDEQCEVAALVSLWDLVRDGRTGEVAKYIFVTDNPRRLDAFLAWNNRRLTTDRSFDVEWRVETSGQHSEEGEEIADERTVRGSYRLRLFPNLAGPKPDVLVAARLWLFDRINRKLWGHVSPQLKAERKMGDQLLYYPHSLLGVIYLHFAREIEGRSAPGTPCANPKCKRTINATWNRKYCNGRCRDQARDVRDYEKRRKSRRTTPITTPKPVNDGEQTRTAESRNR
jgi:hypothetical protein